MEPGQSVRIVQTEPVGPDSLSVYYKTTDGKLHERMLFRADELSLSIAEAGRPWAFDASGDAFKLAAEAYRINLAHLFDPMMAVHTSNVEPLPHQITAVYESMLPSVVRFFPQENADPSRVCSIQKTQCGSNTRADRAGDTGQLYRSMTKIRS
jgi:hypothetical protein